VRAKSRKPAHRAASPAVGPPEGAAWVWQTRELRASDAWRTQGINARRFIDFLLLELMRSAGKTNGMLKAPYQDLEDFGISTSLIADAIREAEELGLVDADRGGKRVATEYALTWLPLHDGAQATDRWRTYRNPKLKPLPAAKIRNLPSKLRADLPSEVRVDGAYLPSEARADSPKNLPSDLRVPSRSSYQDGDEGSSLSGGALRARGPSRVPPPASSGKPPWRSPTCEFIELGPAELNLEAALDEWLKAEAGRA